jgi:hypothetical protein
MASNSILSKGAIAYIIKDELIKNGLQVSDEDNLCQKIVGALKKSGKYLMLMVDELDQLYKLDGYKYRSAVTTLNNLAYFGNQPSGRVSVIVCGSSTLMEELITTNASDATRQDFPLVGTEAVNLNGTKFLTKRVYSTLPVDLESVATIAEVELPLSDDKKPYLRLVAYYSGCCARNAERLMHDIDTSIDRMSSPDQALSGSKTMGNEDLSHLRRGIMNLFLNKNRVLLQQLFEGTVDNIHYNIAMIDWETQFTPWTYSDFEEVWKEMIL